MRELVKIKVHFFITTNPMFISENMFGLKNKSNLKNKNNNINLIYGTILDHLQPTSIFISIFSSKIEKLYYRGRFAPMYASIIEFLYL